MSHCQEGYQVEEVFEADELLWIEDKESVVGGHDTEDLHVVVGGDVTDA